MPAAGFSRLSDCSLFPLLLFLLPLQLLPVLREQEVLEFDARVAVGAAVAHLELGGGHGEAGRLVVGADAVLDVVAGTV